MCLSEVALSSSTAFSSNIALLKKIVFFTLLLASFSALALEADKNAPVFIEANQVVMSEKTGVSTYTGDVKLKQGSIKINADSIIVYTQNKELQRIIATGKPAFFSQQKNQQVKASANHVEYISKTGILILLDNAKMEQGANIFAGNRIEYDTTNNTLNAKASSTNKQRVTAIIQPDTFRQSEQQ